MASFTRAEIRNILGEAHTDDIENRLIALHLGVVDPLKDNLATYKATADKLPAVQKELDDLKAANDGGYKEKYEAEVKAHKEYKDQIEAEKTKGAKRTALDTFLKDKVNIQRPEARTLILDAANYDEIKLDDKGAITDADALAKSYGEKYSSFVSRGGAKGADRTNPPSGGNSRMTKEQIEQIKNPAERRAAIAANLDLFD